MSAPDGRLADRIEAHRSVSTALSAKTDAEVSVLLDSAVPLGTGIGGTTMLVDIAGHQVFAKQVRVTDVELAPANRRSTANLFGLPSHCHFGVGTIGTPGFGAWREVAVHEATTDWVLTGGQTCFPVLHHWRLLPDHRRDLPDELADIDTAVEYWSDGPEIRRRIEAIRDSTARIILFLEYVPETLHHWLKRQFAAGIESAAAACTLVDRQLTREIPAMNARGLLHFDTHFENILTDGEHLFCTDFGLATSTEFNLDEGERRFLERHRIYDSAYAATHLVDWLVVELLGLGPDDRRAFIASCARGTRRVLPPSIPAPIAEIIMRHAPAAAVVGEFHRRFRSVSRTTPYPVDELARIRGMNRPNK